jgi:hypothetical protein
MLKKTIVFCLFITTMTLHAQQISIYGGWMTDIGDQWGLAISGDNLLLSGSLGSFFLSSIAESTLERTEDGLNVDFGDNTKTSAFSGQISLSYIVQDIYHFGIGWTSVSVGLDNSWADVKYSQSSIDLLGGFILNNRDSIFFEVGGGYRIPTSGTEASGTITVNNQDYDFGEQLEYWEDEFGAELPDIFVNKLFFYLRAGWSFGV